ncbi:MAG: class I SAM-dependent methyltransferase [Candidatus Pacearchaeota archaeon]|jgi:2-polyprenyl-3-methyl-5-hydroxy-6-metoxy-1,4-benzoquinol methylase
MGKYLEVIYFKQEYSEKDYPQLLCNYVYERFFKEHIKKNNISNPRVLDIGSGKGNHLVSFSRLGMKPTGLDKKEECLAILKDMGFNGIDIKECDIEKDKFPFKDNTFDFIFSKSVLEHVTNTDNFVKEALRVLKPNGIAVFLTPDWKSQRDFFWDDYTHVKAFTRKSLQNAMRINGYSNVTCEYFLQLPIVWKYPILNTLLAPMNLIPNRFKWRDKLESNPRTFIRFSKEKMLLAWGSKPNNKK